ncbi:MAG: hypothetical protein AB7S38_04745 [Vulcanimicrobiota bacterium]
MKRIILALLLALTGWGWCYQREIVVVPGSAPGAAEVASELTRLLASGPPLTLFGEAVSWKVLGPGQGLLTPTDSTQLAVVRDGQVVEWRHEVDEPGSALGLLTWAYADSTTTAPTIQQAEVVPSRAGPLVAGDHLEVSAVASPGATGSVRIGGQTIELIEIAPGLYRGSYPVTPEDRTVTTPELTLTWPDQQSQSRTLTTVEFAGLQRPAVESIEQVGVSTWLVKGRAPAGSQVKAAFVIPLGGLLWQDVLKRNYEVEADETGRFEFLAPLGTLTSSPTGTVAVTAVDPAGYQVVGEETSHKFVSQIRYDYYSAPPFYPNRSFYYNRWGYGYPIYYRPRPNCRRR